MRRFAGLVLIGVMAFGMLGGARPPEQDPSDAACWGQATKVFARTGGMGAHASEQTTPRVGLRNLARTLYEAGVLEDDSMQALGAFVADALGLSIDACQ